MMTAGQVVTQCHWCKAKLNGNARTLLLLRSEPWLYPKREPITPVPWREEQPILNPIVVEDKRWIQAYPHKVYTCQSCARPSNGKQS